MRANTVKVLDCVCEFLGLNASGEIIACAVRNHSFKRHRRAEENGGNVGKKFSNHFFRTGGVGSSAQELSPETLEQIETQSDSIYQEAANLQPELGQALALSLQ